MMPQLQIASARHPVSSAVLTFPSLWKPKNNNNTSTPANLNEMMFMSGMLNF
jgi:hypothetical protein